MISDKLAELLTDQIGSELGASQNYMAIEFYFRHQSLDKWGDLFKDQAEEEFHHARKIMDFLVDVGVKFELPSVGKAGVRFSSAEDAVASALKSEQKVSGQFRTMASVALEEDDYTSFQFLQWFISEQVEEERKMQSLVDLVKSGINLFQAEALLESYK